MFLGEYEHTIDDKNRLTLPAKFREALADGVVLTRGHGRLPRRLPARRTGTRSSPSGSRALDPFSPGGARAEAVLLRRRRRRRARQAGPHDRAAGARRARAARARGRRRRRPRPPRDLGPRAPGADSSTRSKGVRRMLPNVLQTSATDHVPVLAEEVRELLAVQPGETVVDATFGAGGHAGLLAADLRRTGKLIAIDRDPTVRAYFERFRRTRRRPGAPPARRVRDRPRPARRERRPRPTRSCSTSASRRMQLDRPERGFSYAVDAPLDMRMDPSAELSARELVNEADERELARDLPPLRRGALRAADRARDRAAPRRAAVRAHGRARRRHQAGDPGAGALRRRPSGQARLPGAAHRGQRRARRARGGAARGASRCCGRAAGSP